MKRIFILLIVLISACAEDADKDLGSITFSPPPNTSYNSVIFAPTLDNIDTNETSFTNTWYSTDPNTAISGVYLVVNITVLNGELDSISFFDRPEFSMPTVDTMYFCFMGNSATCPNNNVVVNTNAHSISFTDFVIPQFSNSSGRDMPSEYVINGTLYY